MKQSTVLESPLKGLFPESPVKNLLPKSSLKDLLPVDSKPPVVSRPPEVSTLPLVKKVAVKKVDSVSHRERSPRSRERWNAERRPRDPRLYCRPDFRPPYRKHDFKPRVFRRPFYA
ncbi:hypothetical protein TNCV_339881 [Trichonephila clavipes]|nr:hypothetical protein TNCV_339881 [Trichonephila clavipes]